MICSASCGNFVATRCDSASAVCFIGPQRPSATIENDRSTHNATAAEARRSVSATSKSSTSTRPADRRRRPADAARRSRSVRTTSSGCSSPNSQRRDAPGELAGRAGARAGRAARGGRLQMRRRRAAAPCRRAGAAPSGSARGPRAPRSSQPCRRSSRSSSCSRRTSSAASRPSWRGHRLDVDVVEGGAGVLLTELVEQVVEVGDVAQRAGRLAVAERRSSPRTRSRRSQFRSGRSARRLRRQRRQLAGEVGVAERLGHQAGQLLRAAPGSASASAARAAAARRASASISSSTSLRLLGEELAVPLHELGERVVGVFAAGVPAEQVVEVAEHLLDRRAGLAGRRSAAPRACRRTAARARRCAARRGSAGRSARASALAQS